MIPRMRAKDGIHADYFKLAQKHVDTPWEEIPEADRATLSDCIRALEPGKPVDFEAGTVTLKETPMDGPVKCNIALYVFCQNRAALAEMLQPQTRINQLKAKIERIQEQIRVNEAELERQREEDRAANWWKDAD